MAIFQIMGFNPVDVTLACRGVHCYMANGLYLLKHGEPALVKRDEATMLRYC